MNPVLTEVKTENIFPFKKILLPAREAHNKAQKLERVNVRIIYIFSIFLLPTIRTLLLAGRGSTSKRKQC